MKSIVIIIPIFNEETSVAKNLAEIFKQARAQSTDIVTSDKVWSKVIIKFLLIDDGSTDNTVACLHTVCESNNDVYLLCLNRNFGKEAAIYAGLNSVQACDAVIVMDSDLQHPPSLIKKMIRLWLDEDYEVIDACKKSRGKETFSKKILTRFYLAVFDYFSGLNIKDQSDYKLLDKKVVDVYCQLPEQDRFFRGLIDWMQFKTAQIYFDVPVYHNKISSWSRWKLAKYAVSSITSFTSNPLQAVTLFGFITFLLSIIIGGIALYDKLSGNALDGFTTVIFLILIIGSIFMFSLGLIGIYLAKIYDEIKSRPTYLVNNQNSRLKDADL